VSAINLVAPHPGQPSVPAGGFPLHVFVHCGCERIRNRYDDETRSTSPADAAQAFVNRVVFPPHLLQRLQILCVRSGLGLTLRRKRNGLTLIAGLPLGLRLDEPALLHRRHSGSRADHEAEQNADETKQGFGLSPGRFQGLKHQFGISATAVGSLSPMGEGLVRGHGLSIDYNPGSHLEMRHSRSFASASLKEWPPKAAYTTGRDKSAQKHKVVNPRTDPCPAPDGWQGPPANRASASRVPRPWQTPPAP